MRVFFIFAVSALFRLCIYPSTHKRPRKFFSLFPPYNGDALVRLLFRNAKSVRMCTQCILTSVKFTCAVRGYNLMINILCIYVYKNWLLKRPLRTPKPPPSSCVLHNVFRFKINSGLLLDSENDAHLFTT